ncbi:MAG: glycine zipper 2TM domain-containing protein [Burkholderiales bacterium]|nr:glycine zipper 2TM domain-containing protein [Burkholderiales bacterium]MDE2609111.1 glycine zipper 2TM domain-containing protein [Burkholderiales bacterium]
MDTNNSSRRLHPLVATAAGAVLVASLVAVAAITGVLPKALGTNGPTPGVTQAGGTPQPTSSRTAEQYAAQARAREAQEARAHQRASVCSACGTVASVTPVRTQGASTGIGAIGGALAGGLLGNQFGAGNGRAAMTVVGAVGGGLAGNEVEKNMRSETYYRVSVHMDNGTWRSFNYRSAPGVQPGTRVRLENGRLVMAG